MFKTKITTDHEAAERLVRGILRNHVSFSNILHLCLLIASRLVFWYPRKRPVPTEIDKRCFVESSTSSPASFGQLEAGPALTGQSADVFKGETDQIPAGGHQNR